MEHGHWKSKCYESKRYLEALIALNKSRFWHIAFFVEFVAFQLAADLKYISLKKKAGRKTFFINKEQTRICLIMSLARIKAVQGYFGWRFPTTVLLTSEITQINRHCPWMHFASSLKKIIKSLQKVSPALLPVSDFLPPQTVLTLPCESRFCFCLKELSLKT